MKAIAPLLTVLAIALLAYLGAGVAGLTGLFGIVIPYLSFALFIGGFVYRIFDWAGSPVPFRIPTTAGQSRSLDWIRQDKLESPSGFWGVTGRVLL